MGITSRKWWGEKFARRNFYNKPQTCYVSGEALFWVLQRNLLIFLPHCWNLLRFWWEHPLSKEIFPAVKIGWAFFSENSADFSPKTAFRQNKIGREGRKLTPRPSFFRYFITDFLCRQSAVCNRLSIQVLRYPGKLLCQFAFDHYHFVFYEVEVWCVQTVQLIFFD